MNSKLDEPKWIAEERVVFVLPDGTRREGRIAVGLPMMVDDVEARCPIILDGVETFPQIAGGSTLQAMLVGIRLLAKRLHDFRTRGGRVEYPGGGDVALEAIFGSLLAE